MSYTKENQIEAQRRYYKNHREKRLKEGRKWRKENKEKFREICRHWRLANPEKVKQQKQRYYIKNKKKIIEHNLEWINRNKSKHRKYCQIWAKRNPDKIKHLQKIDRLRRYGMSVVQYRQMLKEQRGRCFICRRFQKPIKLQKSLSTELCVDHNHRTNEIRKLLCHACNIGIGAFRENIFYLQSAIKYLTNKNKKHICFKSHTRHGIKCLTPQQRNELKKKQNGKCAICKNIRPVLDTDHDHETNEIRGLLCHSCNIGLGALNDNPKLIIKIIDYLKSYKLQTVQSR